MRRIFSVLLSICLMASLTVPAVAAPAKTSSGTASTLRLESAEGTVQLEDAGGKSLKASSGTRLYNGYTLSTQKASYAFVSLDTTKAVKLDASTTTEVFQSGKKLELTATSGQLFFNVSAPLKSGESMQIRTSTMVTGVRGTSGWIEVSNRNTTRISLLEGKLDITSIDPVSGSERTTTIVGGQTLTVVYEGDGYGFNPALIGDNVTIQDLIDQGIIDENNIILTGTGLTVEALQEDKVPGFVAVEVAKNTELQKKIEETTNLSVPDIIKDAEKRLAEEEAAANQADQKIQSNLENLSADKTDPLFEASTESTGGGGGGSAPAPVRGVVNSTSSTTTALNAELEQAAADGNDVVVTNTVSSGNDQTPVVVQPGQTMTLANGASLDGGTYDVQGTLSVDPGATVTASGARINVNSTNSLEISGTLINNGGGVIIVGDTDDGALRILSGGELINEDGTLYVGPYNSAESGGASGLLEIAEGGTLSSGVMITEASSLTNNGIINGTITVSNTGTLTNNGTINGSVNLNGGTVNHYGTITAASRVFDCFGSGGTLKISGATVTSTESSCAINLLSTAAVIVENSTITAADTAIGNSEGGISGCSITVNNSQIRGANYGINMNNPFGDKSETIEEGRHTISISSDSTVTGGIYGVWFESATADLTIGSTAPSNTSHIHWYDVTTDANNTSSASSPITYTVTCWEDTDKISCEEQTVTADIPTAFSVSYPERNGYTCEGWFTADGTKYTIGQILNLSDDLELFAHWSANSYIIRFDANADDATGTMTEQSFVFGDTTVLSSNQFSREGYVFEEWNYGAGGNYQDIPENAALSDLENIDNFKDINGVVTLYAQWIPVYTIVYHANNGSTPEDTQQESFTMTSNEALYYTKSHDTFSNEGFFFDLWVVLNADEAVYASAAPKYDIANRLSEFDEYDGSEDHVVHFYAEWVDSYMYDLLFYPNYEGASEYYTCSLRSIPHTAEIILSATPAENNGSYATETGCTGRFDNRDGYTLTGWNTAADGSGTFYRANAVEAGLSPGPYDTYVHLYAQWEPNNS